MPETRTQADQGWFQHTIAGRITVRMLVVAALPVLIMGGAAAATLLALADQADDKLSMARTEVATETVGAARAEQSAVFLGQLDRFLDERFDDLVDWSRDDGVITATVTEYQRTLEVAALSPPIIESRLSGQDQLDASGAASRFLLEQLGDGSTYRSLLLTDDNGFVVGTTRPDDDFIHADQSWWEGAWTNGAYLGTIATDDTGALGFELAVRVDGRPDGRGSGVVQAILDPAAVHSLADEFAGAEAEVWLVTDEGLLMAETASGHDPARLGTRPDFDDGVGVVFEQSLDGSGSGVVVADIVIGGYDSSAPALQLDRLGTEVTTPRLLSFSAQPTTVAVHSLGPLDQLATDLDTAAITTALIAIGLTIGALLLAYVVADRLAAQITEPLEELGAEARRLSESELPSLVRTLRSTDGSGELPIVDLIEIDADEEVAELAMAFNALRATTVELAATQAIDRSKDLAGVLVNLGRRNQHLIGRQLQFIDRLEATESDPDALENLFTLDQLATRMRRNAESLLVLAGERVPRRASEPQPVHEILRAAAGEVEHYTRVSMRTVEPALVAPGAVSDLTHLLAELIENATRFSPADTTVDLVGGWDDRNGYTMSVVDHGPGLSRSRLAEANARLSSAAFDETPTSHLGLFVVGRLAARHRIDARLVQSAGIGTTATVSLPARCVTAVTEPDDKVIGSRLRNSDLVAPTRRSWPLPQRLSRSVAAPAPMPTIERPTRVPDSITMYGHDALLIDDLEEALELPTHVEPFPSSDPTGPTARDGAQGREGQPVSTAGNPPASTTDETEGVPIPPFRARVSKAGGPPGTATAAGRSERPHPSDPAFRLAGRGSPGAHLEIVANEPDPETRAIEVRDRLSSFTDGVAAAKAEVVAPTVERQRPLGGHDAPDDVVPFRSRARTTAGVDEPTEGEPS